MVNFFRSILISIQLVALIFSFSNAFAATSAAIAKKVDDSKKSNATPTWSPTPFNTINQLVVELEETPGLSWFEFVRLNAGRLKTLRVSWDDYRTAVNSTVLFRTVPTTDPELRKQYERILSEASPTEIVDFNDPANRSFETLTSKIWAVHSTNYFPYDKIALTPLSFYFRPTIHFALGGLVRGHHGFSWEQKRFAVLVPLKELLPQILSLMPQDTFIAGEFDLPTSAIVLVPEEWAAVYNEKLSKAQLRTYNSRRITLRGAINEVLVENRAWQIKSHPENTTMLPRAYVDGVNIHQVPFFHEIKKRYPELRFGSHVISIVDKVAYAGLADNINTQFSFLPATDLGQMYALIATEATRGLLDQIDRSVTKPGVREFIKERYRQIEPQLQQNIFSRNTTTPLPASDREHYEQNAGHFLHGFDSATAERLIQEMNEGSGVLSKRDRLIKQKIARLILLDLASGPSDGMAYEAVQDVLQEAKKSDRLPLITQALVQQSPLTHENSISFFAQKDFGSYHILVKWLGFLKRAGFFDNMKSEELIRTESVKNDLACIPTPPTYAKLINVKSGWQVGQPFGSKDYCLKAIQDSTADLVCGIANDGQISIFAHANFPMALSVLRFVELSNCGRLLPSVLR